MADIEFILSVREQQTLTEFLFGQNARLVPSVHYSEPRYVSTATPDDVERLIASSELTGPFFILADAFSRHPLEMDSFEKRGKTMFYIVQGHGGPYIEFLPCKTIIRQGTSHIVSGIIGYQAKYWVNLLADNAPPPNELKDMYKKITRQIRSNTKKVVTKMIGRTYWVGEEALNCLKKGYTTNASGLVLPVRRSTL